MKTNRFLIILFFIGYCQSGRAQATESPYVTRILNFEWMPDDTFLLTIVKFDKTRKEKPQSRVYSYNPDTKAFNLLLVDAGRPSPSPDGQRIAFEKKLPEDKSDVYVYDLKTKTQEPLIRSDTLYKFGPNWSPDGKQIAYNIKRGKYNMIDVCIADVRSGQSVQITQSGEYSSYNPVWSPKGDQLVYYFEKGDNRDQIFITDPKGSYHINVSADTSVHNYYPSWINNQTILYTWAPTSLAKMNADGTQKQKFENIKTFFARYNPNNKKIAYLEIPENNLMLYDVRLGESKVVINVNQLEGLF